MSADDPLYIDIETFSDVDLRRFGVYRYSESPAFQVLFAFWARGDGPVRLAMGEHAIRLIPGLFDPSVTKVAHNAMFERVCLSRVAGYPTGTYLDPEEWHDTQAVAGEYGYPQSLAGASRALGADPKDEAGTRLINLFCKPNRNGSRTLPEDRPKEWLEFLMYGEQDVLTLRDIHRRGLHTFPTDTERRLWVEDQRINDRGMEVDMGLAQAGYVAGEDNRVAHVAEVQDISGIDNPGSVQQVSAWLRERGVPVPNLQAATVTATLERDDLEPVVRRVLELRQELSLAAVAKYSAALGAVSDDGRLRGGFRFFGAHTGRWAGRGVQPHNLPREQLDSPTATEAAVVDLLLGHGADPIVLKALVRALFVGPFTVIDYSAIEARVIAWLAGEQWALDAFNAGRDIYVETAERMSTDREKLTRFQGKVAVLALGYNGGVNSLRAMGAEGDDPTLQRLVDQWRTANPNIVALWGEMQEAFGRGGPVGERMEIVADGDTRWLQLPSGRAIGYHRLKTEWVTTQYGTRKRQHSFADPKKPGRVRTYGGRLTENATQAVARDLLAEALLQLAEAGLPVVAHVHDEVIIERATATTLRDAVAVMTTPPTWADGLPIGAEGFTTYRYRKG